MDRRHDRNRRTRRLRWSRTAALAFGLALAPGASAFAAPAGDDAAADTEPTKSHRQRRHEALVASVESRLVALTRHIADPKRGALSPTLATLSPELLMLADCVDAKCTLNALGHARVLVDWTDLRKDLEILDKALPAPAGLVAPAAALGAPIAAAVTSSAKAAIEAFLDWTEKAIKRRLQREAIVALVDRLTNELCTKAAKRILPRTCALATDKALNHVSAGNAQLAVIRAAVVADLAELPARGFVTDDPVFPGPEFDTARERFVARLRVGESPALLFADLGLELRASKPSSACYLELMPRALEFADPLAGQPSDLAAASAFIAAAVTTDTCAGVVQGAGTKPAKAAIAEWQDKHETLAALAGPWRIAVAASGHYAASAEAIVAPEADAATTTSVDARVERARRHALAATAFASAMDRLAIAFVGVHASVLPKARDSASDDVLGLRGLQRRIDLVELSVVGDWGRLIAEVSETNATKDEKAKEEQAELRKLSGMLTALATEQGAEELFAAVQAAALPAASWRTKMRSKAFTASIGAQLGVTSAAELRFGTYGASYYAGDVAWAAPTLFFPMGLDLAWKKKHVTHGAFFSVIDPAAFLQYDIHEGGRLPGARLTTIVAPGIAYRVSLGNRPLSFMLYAVFRPQLRTWEPTISGPGASVLQFGAAITWDIPFYVMRVREAGR
jgi:hypothetical protein